MNTFLSIAGRWLTDDAVLISLLGIALLAATTFWVWMVVEVLTSPRLTRAERITWLVVTIGLYVSGAAIYWGIKRPALRADDHEPHPGRGTKDDPGKAVRTDDACGYHPVS